MVGLKLPGLLLLVSIITESATAAATVAAGQHNDVKYPGLGTGPGYYRLQTRGGCARPLGLVCGLSALQSDHEVQSSPPTPLTSPHHHPGQPAGGGAGPHGGGPRHDVQRGGGWCSPAQQTAKTNSQSRVRGFQCSRRYERWSYPCDLCCVIELSCHTDAGEEKKCVEKIVLEQQTEWSQEIECHHRFVGLFWPDSSKTKDDWQVPPTLLPVLRDCLLSSPGGGV